MAGFMEWLFGDDEPPTTTQNTQGKTSGTSSSTGTTTTGPNAMQLQILQALMPGILGQINTPPQMNTPGVAGINQQQNQAFDWLRGAAKDMRGIGRDAARSNSFLMDKDILSPDSNPYLRQVMEASREGITQNLMENILPGISDQAIAAGGLGGSRQGIAQGLGIGRTSEAIANAQAQLGLGGYNAGLNAMGSAIGRAPSIQGMQTAPGQVLLGIGNQQQVNRQAMLDDQIKREMYNQLSPMQNMQDIMQMMGMIPGSTVNQTQTGSTTGTNTNQGTQTTVGGQPGHLGQLLGTGATLASLFMGNPAAALSPAAAAATGAGGSVPTHAQWLW